MSSLYAIIFNGSELNKSSSQREIRYAFNLYPTNITVQLSQSNIPAKVTKFDFKSLIVSLLLDPLIMDSANLLMTEQSFIDPCNAHHDSFGDIHTGYWFRNAHQYLCKNDNDLLCPLIFFIDGVGLDAMQRQGLEPVTFTLGIFNRKARNSSKFWRILGYIPNLEKVANFNYKLNKNKLLKKEHYHEMLNSILSDVKQLQKDNGLTWTFPNGKTYNLKFPLMYCIGDALGLDKLCHRKLNYTPSKTMMTGCCRDCNMVYKHCHDPSFVCKFHKSSTINSLPPTILDKLSFVPVKTNAFDGMCDGNNSRGMLGACPPEPLHQWYLGVMTMVLEYIWMRVSNKALEYLDKVICGLSIECHRQSDRDMPNISMFQRGLMREKLTGEERGNQLFMLYLSLLPTKVKSTLVSLDDNNAARKSNKNNIVHGKIINSNTKFDNWLHVLEQMLAISEWLKLDNIPVSDVEPSVNITLKQNKAVFDPDVINSIDEVDCDDNACANDEQDNDNDESDIDSDNDDDIVDVECTVSKANIQMRNFMNQLLSVFDKKDHNILQTMKNHHSLHYDTNVCSFGSVPNFNGGCNEENMKSQVTNPSQLTQKRTSSLGYQTAIRYTEKLIVDIGHNIAMHTKQYNTQQFQGSKNYFTKLGEDHYTATVHYDHSARKSTGWIAFGNQSFHHVLDYDSDEHGDRHIQSSFTRTYVHKNKSVTEMLCSDSYYNESFMTNVFDLLSNLSLFPRTNNEKTIASFQTLKRDEYIFRCSPKYHSSQNANEWMDWVNVSWKYNDDTVKIIPARIMMFINRDKTCEENNQNIECLSKTCPPFHLWAIVRSCKDTVSFNRRESNFHKSKLATYMDMEDELNIISCSNIHSPAYVLPDRDYSTDNDTIATIGNLKRVIVLKDRDTWSKLFIS